MQHVVAAHPHRTLDTLDPAAPAELLGLALHEGQLGSSWSPVGAEGSLRLPGPPDATQATRGQFLPSRGRAPELQEEMWD